MCGVTLSRLMNYCYSCGQEHLLENEFDFDECKCGAEVHPKFNFCYACGRDISDEWNNVIKRAKGFKLEWECDEGCGGNVQEFMSYCPWCGEEQYWESFYSDDFECNQCEVSVSKEWQYCPFCGKEVDWAKQFIKNENDDIRQLFQEYEKLYKNSIGILLEMKEFFKKDIRNYYEIKSSLEERREKFDYQVTKMLSRYGYRNLSIRKMMDKEWDSINLNDDIIPIVLIIPVFPYVIVANDRIVVNKIKKLKIWKMYIFKVRNLVHNVIEE